jgi:hypothetical protein
MADQHPNPRVNDTLDDEEESQATIPRGQWRGLVEDHERLIAFVKTQASTNAKLEALIKGLTPPLLPKALKIGEPQKFDGTRSNLRGFLANMALHLRVNADRLPKESDKVSFVAAQFTGKTSA